jgi:ceramide glucosyltransferase
MDRLLALTSLDLAHGALGLSVFALTVFALGVAALAYHVRRRAAGVVKELPPVSILKPLKGVEEGLEANLESFFVQRYPGRFEIVFATTEDDDPAIAIAREVAARHPDVPVRFAHSDADFGLNPKVSNLRGAMRAAQHDLVLQSDANVIAQPDYLARVVEELVGQDGHLLSSLVVGVGERSAGACMENLQLGAMIVPSCCFALHYFGVPCVIGKSMLLRRSDLAKVGGLESVRDVLAEDYLLGRAFQAKGMKVILSSTVAQNVNEHVSVDKFMSRHARWLKMRSVIHVPAFIADALANPAPWATLALVLGLRAGEPWIAGAAFGVLLGKVALDAVALRLSRGSMMGLRAVLLGPLKDLLLFSVWPYAAISRSIEWRGTKLRMGWGTKLRKDEGNLLTRTLRRAFA